MKQKTLKKEVTIKGVGLHTGRRCRATLRPAPENSGIDFVRTDLPGQPVFHADVSNVIDIIRGTTLGEGESRVYTIEHVLSALSGFGIDNARIELDDNEPPVGDGSAKLFVDAIRSAGVIEQNAEKVYFTVETPFEYQASQTIIRIEPLDYFEIMCEIDYNHPLLKNQTFTFSERLDYEKEIAPARTYCFDYEIEALKKKGLAKGGSLDNAIVIGPTGIYNPDAKLRFENEFVRHKILDLMGDLMLIGRPLKARVIAKRCGHGHNIKALKQLLTERPLTPSLSV
jgi:UDP-3-O-[3-hydroxymyristoyl] N-acetylglucosamine deacetylase / 3-hydroxyacyl-[acyl-carrier-protein] dehydratase